MPNILGFMAWKIDPILLEFMQNAIVELDQDNSKPKERCSKEVKINSLLCAMVDFGTAQLLRDLETGEMCWAPTELFYRIVQRSRR